MIMKTFMFFQQKRRDVGEALDKKLQLYLKQIRSNGIPLMTAIAIGAARGLLLVNWPPKQTLGLCTL